VSNSEPSRLGTLIGVGVGPGDPSLMTISAYRSILAADLVVAPSANTGHSGRAEKVVRHYFPYLNIQRLYFPTTSTNHRVPSSLEAMLSFQEAALQLREPLESGENVVFVTLGDPNLYSTFTTLTRAVRRILPNVKTRTIPGIMAFQVLAARSGTPLACDEQSLEIITAHRSVHKLDEALKKKGHTIVVYKSGHSLEEIASILSRHGRLEGAEVGELLGMPEESYGDLQEFLEPSSPRTSYFTTILIPPLQEEEEPLGGRADDDIEKSPTARSRHVSKRIPSKDGDGLQ